MASPTDTKRLPLVCKAPCDNGYADSMAMQAALDLLSHFRIRGTL